MLITYCEINDIMSKLNFILEIFRRHLNQLICIPYVPNYKKKKLIFFVSNYKQKRLTFIIFNYVISQNYLFQKKIQCKVYSIWSLFHFLYNQLPMKIVFTFSYKTYFKDNTKNYVTNHCVLVFLSSVVFFSLLINHFIPSMYQNPFYYYFYFGSCTVSSVNICLYSFNLEFHDCSFLFILEDPSKGTFDFQVWSL